MGDKEASDHAIGTRRKLRPFLLAAAVLAVAAIVVALSSCGDEESSPQGASELILDPSAPVRPIVTGTYEFHGPEGSFTQPFVGKLLYNGPCATYGREGGTGVFSSPYALYPTGTKLDHSLSGAGVTISNYKGPGEYTSAANQLTGSLSARDGNGAEVGTASVTYDSSFTFTAKADAGGRIHFEGQNRAESSSDQRVSGTLTWTCKDTRLSQSAYSLNAYS